MVSGLNNGNLLGLFGGSSSGHSGSGIINLDLSSLLITPRTALASSASKVMVPAAPWNSPQTPAEISQEVRSALAGQPILGASTQKLSTPDPTGDYGKLFSLYQALATLEELANTAAKNKDPLQAKQLDKAFQGGLAQISSFVNTAAFKGLRLADGATQTSAQAALTTSKPATSYATGPLTTSMTDDVPAFDGDVQFDITVKLHSKTTDVPIDLANMGSQPRSLSNVVIYINQQLKAAGVETRVAIDRIPGVSKTITSGGKAITLPPGPDQFAMQVNIGTSETVSFSAPQSANAVYIGETVGDPNPDGDPTTKDSDTNSQLVKIQTDTGAVPAAPQGSQGNYVPGQVFSQNLGPHIGTVHATQMGPDGSVYMLADVSGTVNGQSIQGSQDVALLKYDSAGALVYTRVLGASSSATGLGLAVSSTGQVAVAGSVTGGLLGAADGALNSGATGAFAENSDSFVTLYDDHGDELWTARRGARLNDQASAVAFSADGKTVYVAGQAQGAIPGGAASQGGYDGYVEGFTTDPKTGGPKAAFTQTFGGDGQDLVKGMAVDGNTLFTASIESGHAIVRSFDLSSGTPVLQATRDLGDLQGGSIAGVAVNGNGQVVVAGTTANGALDAGTVTSAASGSTDAFVAQVDESLSPTAGDAVAYYGGAGSDRATALTVSNGQVWIAGVAGSDLPGLAPVGRQDGFVANIDVATGTVAYSQRFSGKDQMAAPTSIAVDSSGASVLDRLGLPKGAIGGDQTDDLASNGSLRAGAKFTVAVGRGPPTTITIDPGETLQTLATKIQRATGSQATATVTTSLTGQRQLSISPAINQAQIVLGAGPAGANALPILGLPEGVLSKTAFVHDQSVPADGGPPIYGLGLSSTLNLGDSSQIAHALAVVVAAENVVRRAYNALAAAATPKTAAQQAATANSRPSGPVPAYLTNRLANMQSGLARLTGSTGSSVSKLV